MILVVAVDHIVPLDCGIKLSVRDRIRIRRIDVKVGAVVRPRPGHVARKLSVRIVEERMIGQNEVDRSRRRIRINPVAERHEVRVVQHHAAPERRLRAAPVVRERDRVVGRAARRRIERLIPLAATLEQDRIAVVEARRVHLRHRLPRAVGRKTVVAVAAAVAHVVGHALSASPGRRNQQQRSGSQQENERSAKGRQGTNHCRCRSLFRHLSSTVLHGPPLRRNGAYPRKEDCLTVKVRDAYTSFPAADAEFCPVRGKRPIVLGQAKAA